MTLPVVIVSFNTCDDLRVCLRSLAASTVPTQALVVDNGSSDGSVAMVRAEFPEARLIEPGANLGFAKANNLALREVLDTAPYVLLLNPDAALLPGALERLVAFLDAHPRVAVVAPRLIYPDGRFQAAAFRFPTLTMALFDLWPPRGPLLGRLYHHRLNGRYPADGGAAPFPIDHPLGAAMLMRTAALREVGLFDEAFWLYAEEVELCWRIRRAGWAIWQEPGATVAHVGGASSAKFRSRSFLALHTARATLMRRLHGRGWFRAYRALHRLASIERTLGALWAWRRGRIDANELRQRTWAWGRLHRLFK